MSKLILEEIFTGIPHNQEFSLKYLILSVLYDKRSDIDIMTIPIDNRTEFIEHKCHKNLFEPYYSQFLNKKLVKLVSTGIYISGENYLLARELGGYHKYNQFRTDELTKESKQKRINVTLILVAILSAFSAPVTTLIDNITAKPVILTLPRNPAIEQQTLKLDSSSLEELERLLLQKPYNPTK